MNNKRNIGLIVGGLTEYLAFSFFVPRKNIRVVNALQGNTRDSGLVRHITTNARTLTHRCRTIVAILDRESRTESAQEIEKRIRDRVQNQFENQVNVIVSCPDLMIENWMLADVDSWKNKKYLRENIRQKNYEGHHGEREIKKLFKRNCSYSKTTNGVDFLTAIRSNTATTNSESYSRFSDATGF